MPPEVVSPSRPVSPYSVYCVRRTSGIRYYHRSKAGQEAEPRSKSSPPYLSSEPNITAGLSHSPLTRRRASRALARKAFEDNHWVEIGARPKDRRLSAHPTSSKKEYHNTTRTPNEDQKHFSPRHSIDQENSKKDTTTAQRMEWEHSPRKKTFKARGTSPNEEHDFNHSLWNRERSVTVGYVYADQKSSPRKYLQYTDRTTSSCHSRPLPSLEPVEPILTLYESLERLRLLSRLKADAEDCSERLRTYRQNLACIAAAVPIKSTEEFGIHDTLSPYARCSPPSPALASPETTKSRYGRVSTDLEGYI